MSGAFNEQQFEQKLVTLKDTQEAINTLSSWCLQNKEHHKKIVTCWLHCLKRVKIEVRLSLFYLANDVIQYSKRKHLDFVESWGTALQKATPLVRDDKVRHRIQRIFKIWEERGVYDEAFISDLCGLLTTTVKKKSDPVETTGDPTDFQPSALVRKIKEIKVLGENTDIKYKRIKDNKLPLTDAESMRLSLKDRRHGSDVAAEVDSGVKKMEAFVKALEQEISAREKLINLLHQATLFYETQRGEAKIVANAYRNFGNRLKTKKKALDELLPTLLSPLPSPDVNAPSPSPDSDLDASVTAPKVQEAYNLMCHAPSEAPMLNGADLDLSSSLVNSSFIGSAQFMGLTKEVFGTDKPQPVSEPQPIEVIGGRDAGANFDVTEFLKSLMPTKEPSLPPPPMPPVFADWSSAAPWDQPPAETPQSPPMYEKQVPHTQPVEYDDSMPVPPVPDVDHRTMLAVPPPQPSLPALDMDHRGPPPPSIMNVDVDHRGPLGMGMHGIDLSERGALIAPPPPIGMLGPPPPPPAVQALLDIDQRNLINLTGSPGSRPPLTGHQEAPCDLFPPTQEAGFLQHTPWNRHHPADLRESDPRVKDNVESIDMDVSEDDEESHARAAGSLRDLRKFGPGPGMRDPPFGGPLHHGLQHHPFPQHNEPPRQHMAVEPPHMGELPYDPNAPPMQKLSLTDRLTALQNAGAKLIPPEQPPPDENGFANDDFGGNGDFGGSFGGGGGMGPRQRWQSPRQSRGSRPARSNFPYRGASPHRGSGQSRNFRPRGRW